MSSDLLPSVHMQQNAAYFDHAASTPLDPRAREAVLRALDLTGNPSSIHGFGRACKEAIETAREQVARLVGAPPSSVVFTSGATEANLLALRGTIDAARRSFPGRRFRALASPVEHASVRAELLLLQEAGAIEVVWMPIDADGVVRAEEVLSLLTEDVVLVAMQWVNNVTGVIQPVAAIGALVVRERVRRGPKGLPLTFACDAVQAVRTLDVRPLDLGVDLCTFSSHKMYGPKGVGALIRRPGLALEPVTVGGGQEDGLRGGTENLPSIAGFGVAAEQLSVSIEKDAVHAASIRHAFLERLASDCGNAIAPLVAAPTVVDIVHLVGRGLDERSVLTLDARGFAVSSGSACDAGKRRSSHVLEAMGRRDRAGLRVCFGRDVREQDAQALADAIAALVR